jgi:hypothetical protein
MATESFGGITNQGWGEMAGIGLDTMGQMQDSFAQANLYNLSASAHEMDSKTIMAMGELNAQKMRYKADRFLSTQRAMYAKAGVRFEGSPADVWMDSERNASLDILTYRLNTAAESNRAGFQALYAKVAANQAKAKAWQQSSTGILKMGITGALNTA